MFFRGLPHVHCLIWLAEPVHLDQMDKIVSAEIPDRQKDPLLYEIIVKNNMHGPCGEKCMENGKCSKNFPKPFCAETQSASDGYPAYRRRSPQDGGHTFEIRRDDRVVTMTNAWVVPYSPFLSRTFQCHINLELCYSVKSIQYVCKV